MRFNSFWAMRDNKALDGLLGHAVRKENMQNPTCSGWTSKILQLNGTHPPFGTL